jgi:hypothetical protein
LLVEVKRLRVELRGETLDLPGVDKMRFAGESLAEVKIVEVEAVRLGHRDSLGNMGR